ncbi:hypothetical protein GCM10010124_37040 [Pilimelia terevasa]|uniref:VWFA domain-containing protein n=1 Tax=Pilimelia terevasa TaxID=53372 RepID=A0A8J3BTX0_9ACTN|nr:VWA domain-containing protein [Pilimelia terevasa]GGK40786.1 hypothetical protein GCM10010124_37040 [Pilimelia terevasa]
MPDVRGHLLPIYVLADESGSMMDQMKELNNGLASLHEALLGEPMTAAKVRFSIMGFSHDVVLRLHLADLRTESQLPALVDRGTTSYSAAFQALLTQIPVDVNHLKTQRYAVHRPAVFFLSDGKPDHDDRWRPIHQSLTDRQRTLGAPNIIACGIGAADPSTILSVATQPDYAFVAIAGVDIGQSVAKFCTALTKSVIASGRSMTEGSAELRFDKPEGFSMAIDVV